MPSFDVVSSVNMQEVKNAVDQSKKELQTRYDFRGSKASIEIIEEKFIELIADDQMKLTALQEILKLKLSKRGVSTKLVEFQDAKPAGGDTLRQEVLIKTALKDTEIKKITKAVKELPFKVSAQIQGEQVRISGKQRDDLQSTIAHLRASMSDLELQFINFRD
ncbi:MAG: YajQ family cyclic di-GMP-binding protein [Proteobacteria bacterium]|nr:YajQ family cyclic di-GMP-binding protein [Pseudomonadota bacterium]